jgi:hypothetical protein
MRTRKIGNLEVPAVGPGTMGFSHGYGPGVGDDEAVDLMRKAFDLGCTFFDTAESYAAGENERLVGRALAPIRDHVVIATKLRVGDSASSRGASVPVTLRSREPDTCVDVGPRRVDTARTFAAAALGSVLRISDGSACRLIADGLDLRHRLRSIWRPCWLGRCRPIRPADRRRDPAPHYRAGPTPTVPPTRRYRIRRSDLARSS